MERPEQRVALIEWLDREGHVQRSVDVAAWPLSLGRALDNTVVLDDPFVAAHHARLLPGEDGRLLLQALPSHNGLRLDGRALDGPTPVPAGGGLLQLGQTRLRLRVADADAALAPEKPLPATPALTRRGPLLAAGALMALVLGGQWLSLDPGADYTAWLPLALGLPAVVMVWCGIWALLSKLFQHRFDFSGHLRIALPWLLAMQVGGQPAGKPAADRAAARPPAPHAAALPACGDGGGGRGSPGGPGPDGGHHLARPRQPGGHALHEHPAPARTAAQGYRAQRHTGAGNGPAGRAAGRARGTRAPGRSRGPG